MKTLKKIIIFVTLLCLSVLTAEAQTYPIQNLNIKGQLQLNGSNGTSGQVLQSQGTGLAPLWGTVSIGSLSNIAANTVIANASGVSATPTAIAVPSCTASAVALQWISGTGYSCGITFTSNLANAVTSTLQTRLLNVTYASDFGVVSNGATDDSTNVNNAIASGNTVVFPTTTTLTNSATTATSYRWASFGGAFSGTNNLDKAYPAFGPGTFRAVSVGANNGIIGIAYNNAVANTAIFPTGVTGYGRSDNNGNEVFGLFGRADIYATGGGVVTNEVNTFNYGAAPSSTLPPNRSFGTTQQLPITLTVAAGGNFNSAIGIHVTQEGSAPQSFLTGIYTDPTGVINNGIIVGASSTQGPTTSAELQNSGSGVNLNLITMGTASPSNNVFQVLNSSRTIQAAITQNGQATFGGGIKGVTGSGLAGPGTVGEIITNSASGVSLSNATPTNVTSVNLTAGQWSCSGVIEFVPASSTVTTAYLGSLSSTSGVMGGVGSRFQLQVPFTNGAILQSFPTPVLPINIASPITLYAVAQANFSTSTQTANAAISCLRTR